MLTLSVIVILDTSHSQSNGSFHLILDSTLLRHTIQDAQSDQFGISDLSSPTSYPLDNGTLLALNVFNWITGSLPQWPIASPSFGPHTEVKISICSLKASTCQNFTEQNKKQLTRTTKVTSNLALDSWGFIKT